MAIRMVEGRLKAHGRRQDRAEVWRRAGAQLRSGRRKNPGILGPISRAGLGQPGHHWGVSELRMGTHDAVGMRGGRESQGCGLWRGSCLTSTGWLEDWGQSLRVPTYASSWARAGARLDGPQHPPTWLLYAPGALSRMASEQPDGGGRAMQPCLSALGSILSSAVVKSIASPAGTGSGAVPLHLLSSEGGTELSLGPPGFSPLICRHPQANHCVPQFPLQPWCLSSLYLSG